MRPRTDQWWLKPDHIAIILRECHQHAMIAQEMTANKARQRTFQLLIQHGQHRAQHHWHGLREIMKLKSHHHALAPDILDKRRVPSVQVFQTIKQIVAGFCRVIDQMLIVKYIDRFNRGDAGFTNTTKGCHGMDHRRFRRAVSFHIDVALGDHRGHRCLATTKRLGKGSDIRNDTIMLECIELAGAAKTALHFVRHPDHAILIAKLAQLLPEGSIGLNDSAAALNGFQHNNANFRIRTERVFNGINIAERHANRIIDQLEITAVKPTIGDR